MQEATDSLAEELQIQVGLRLALLKSERHNGFAEIQSRIAKNDAVFEQWIEPLGRLRNASHQCQNQTFGGTPFLTPEEDATADYIQSIHRHALGGGEPDICNELDMLAARALLEKFRPALEAVPEDEYPDRRANTDEHGHCDDPGDADYSRLIVACRKCLVS